MPGGVLVRQAGADRLTNARVPHLGLLISCKEASRLLSQMQDGGVPLGPQLGVRLHLLFCDACTRFATQLRFLRAVMRRYSRREE